MKNWSHLIIGLAVCTVSLGTGCSSDHSKKLTRYSPVPEQEKYPRGLQISPRYRVMAKATSDSSVWNVEQHATATYEAWPDYLDPETIPSAYKDIAVHFVQVDADQRIRFRVELLQGEIETLKVVPSRYEEVRETLSSDKRWIEFEVDASDLTKHILVEINEPNDSPILNHGLMVFLNPVTPKLKGKVLELPSGVVGLDHPAMSDDRCIHIVEDSPYDAIYIPNDTIVDGRIQIHKKGFTVTGRGMLCGSSWKYAKQENWPNHYPITRDHKIVKGLCEGAGDTIFEGIMTVHPYHFNFTNAEHFINLKAFGWRHSSDGFHGKYIRGCFSKVNDDHQYSNEGIIERGSYWGMNNGGIFQLGWGGAAMAKGGNGHVKECNVLRCEWPADGGARQNNGVFSGVIFSPGIMRNNLFEDIRVDGQCFRFIAYRLGEGVALEDFTFKDIWYEKPFGVPEGYQKAGEPYESHMAAGQGITGFVFDNIVVSGKKVTSLEDFDPMLKENLGEVTFK